MKEIERIAVIGAGLAGLSCARHLQQQGLEVQLFEKSRGAAGRMSTRRGDDWQCDHGAQYFTARDPDFRTEVARWQALGAEIRVAGGEVLGAVVALPVVTAPGAHAARGAAALLEEPHLKALLLQMTGTGQAGKAGPDDCDALDFLHDGLDN